MSGLVGFVLGTAVGAAAMAQQYKQDDTNKEQQEDEVGDEIPTNFTSSRAGGGIGGIGIGSRSAMGAVTSLQSQHGFLSDLLAQLWPYINEAVCNTLKETVEPTFAETLPGPLSSLHFTQLDLGHVPLRLDNIIVHKVERNTQSLQLDLDVLWDGQSDIRSKADYLGSFGVQRIKFAGRLSVLLKPLVNTMDLVQAVQIAFANPPTLDLDFVGLANVADWNIMKRRIQAIIQDTLKSMMVLPNRMLTKLNPKCSFLNIYTPPLGILRVTVVQGTGFVNEQRT